MLILGRDKEVATWAARLMPIPVSGFANAVAIGVSDDSGSLIAAAVFTDYRILPFGKDIQIQFASVSPRWATRGHIRGILAYPWRQLGVARLTTINGRKNKRARKLCEGLGFHLEGVHKHAYDGKQDAISYAMYPQDAARWIGEVRADALAA